MADMSKSLQAIKDAMPSADASPSPASDDNGSLYSLRHYEKPLVDSFCAACPDGSINWSACAGLRDHLHRLFPASGTSISPIHTPLHEFLPRNLNDRDSAQSFETLARKVQAGEDEEYINYSGNI